jgi:Sec-independent protein translocase protein TatA
MLVAVVVAVVMGEAQLRALGVRVAEVLAELEKQAQPLRAQRTQAVAVAEQEMQMEAQVAPAS